VTTSAQHGVPLLQADNIRTVFATPRGQLRAVDGVSIQVSAGETLGIVGESGSGKSVLGRTIMGLLQKGPALDITGTVTFAGRDMSTMKKSEMKHFWGPEIAMVFQDPMTSLNPFKRIGTHITESLKFHLGLKKDAARDRAAELLSMVGIPEPKRRLDQYPHELSGGMRQRVVIAMALACEPKLLIADEPTTALDVTVQKQILDLLASLNDKLNMAVILISHDLGGVSGRSDRVAVMYAGSVVETSATEELFTRPRHPYTEALMAAIPRLESPTHTVLQTIPGGLPDMTKPITGCRFAARCRYAQDDCLTGDPALAPGGPGDNTTESHTFACHYPVDTPEGTTALVANEKAGTTAAGLSLAVKEMV